MKVLILAYAVEPDTGSEYGVGWMVPTVMARRHPEHDIYVLTRSRCRNKIETSLNPSSSTPILPNREGAVDSTLYPNLHFLFYDIPSLLFYKKEIGSKWGEQYNYLLWQMFVLGFIKKFQKVAGFRFDVIHHLTFNQYRTPSPGFFVKTPFLMGPVGGAETIAEAFFQDLTDHSIWKERIRRKNFDLRLLGLCARLRNNKKVILCSARENLRRIRAFCKNCECRYLPAIAYSPEDFSQHNIKRDEAGTGPFTLIYAGKPFDWKGIRIFLKAAKRAYIDNSIDNFLIKLIGVRTEQEQQMVMEWVREEKLLDNVELIPFIPRIEMLKELAKCNLSVYPAFRDSGSMSVLEASALACPTICFDAGGQDAFPDDILLKIKVDGSYDDILQRFAVQLQKAYDDPAAIRVVGEMAQEYVARGLTWEKKVDDFVGIYERMVYGVRG